MLTVYTRVFDVTDYELEIKDARNFYQIYIFLKVECKIYKKETSMQILPKIVNKSYKHIYIFDENAKFHYHFPTPPLLPYSHITTQF